MAYTHSWRTLGDAIAAASRQAQRNREHYAILRTVKPGYWTIATEATIGADRSRRSVGLMSPDGVFTPGRVRQAR